MVMISYVSGISACKAIVQSFPMSERKRRFGALIRWPLSCADQYSDVNNLGWESCIRSHDVDNMVVGRINL